MLALIPESPDLRPVSPPQQGDNDNIIDPGYTTPTFSPVSSPNFYPLHPEPTHGLHLTRAASSDSAEYPIEFLDIGGGTPHPDRQGDEDVFIYYRSQDRAGTELAYACRLDPRSVPNIGDATEHIATLLKRFVASTRLYSKRTGGEALNDSDLVSDRVTFIEAQAVLFLNPDPATAMQLNNTRASRESDDDPNSHVHRTRPGTQITAGTPTADGHPKRTRTHLTAGCASSPRAPKRHRGPPSSPSRAPSDSETDDTERTLFCPYESSPEATTEPTARQRRDVLGAGHVAMSVSTQNIVFKTQLHKTMQPGSMRQSGHNQLHKMGILSPPGSLEFVTKNQLPSYMANLKAKAQEDFQRIGAVALSDRTLFNQPPTGRMIYVGQKDGPRREQSKEDSLHSISKTWAQLDPTTSALLRKAYEASTKPPTRTRATSRHATTVDAARVKLVTQSYNQVRGLYLGDIHQAFICKLPTKGEAKTTTSSILAKSLLSYPEWIAYMQGDPKFVAVVGFCCAPRTTAETSFNGHLSGLYPIHQQLRSPAQYRGLFEWLRANPDARWDV